MTDKQWLEERLVTLQSAILAEGLSQGAADACTTVMAADGNVKVIIEDCPEAERESLVAFLFDSGFRQCRRYVEVA